jgi:hypothetical protein
MAIINVAELSRRFAAFRKLGRLRGDEFSPQQKSGASISFEAAVPAQTL